MFNLSFKKDKYKINLKAEVCDNTILKNYMNFDYFTNLCKTGCNYYNKSYTCPPNSPTFTDYTKNYNFSLIILMYTEINEENSIKDIHKDLRCILSEILIPLEKNLNGLLTDGGRCLYCNECSYIYNLPCKYPDKIRFSMEAMGIDLDKMSKEILNHTISWNKDYCTVIGSINFNGHFKQDYLKQLILETI